MEMHNTISHQEPKADYARPFHKMLECQHIVCMGTFYIYHTHLLAWKQVNNSLHQSLHLFALIRGGMVPEGGP